MRWKAFWIPILVVLLACVGGSEEKKPRDWKEGVLLSVEKTRELESTTTTTNAEGKVKSTDNGDKYSGQSTTTQTPNYDNYVTYTVEAGNLVYTAKQHLLFPWSKPANVSLGEKFKFAIQKDKLIMLDDDGKESSAKIVKQAVKSTQ